MSRNNSSRISACDGPVCLFLKAGRPEWWPIRTARRKVATWRTNRPLFCTVGHLADKLCIILRNSTPGGQTVIILHSWAPGGQTVHYFTQLDIWRTNRPLFYIVGHLAAKPSLFFTVGHLADKPSIILQLNIWRTNRPLFYTVQKNT